MPSSIGLIAASNRLLLAAIIPRGIPITIEISTAITIIAIVTIALTHKLKSPSKSNAIADPIPTFLEATFHPVYIIANIVNGHGTQIRKSRILPINTFAWSLIQSNIHAKLTTKKSTKSSIALVTGGLKLTGKSVICVIFIK